MHRLDSLLYEHGDRAVPSICRPISLLNVDVTLGPKIVAHRVMRHPLDYTFVYSTFTDNSEGRCPNTSLTQEAEEDYQLNTCLVEKKKRAVFTIVKLSNKCESVLILS